jgi:ectoine hydroxylase-related dioxygenase (phytanoyl-CoA dioxygenase family)
MELVPADEEAVAAFAADGVACVRQVLRAQEVAEAAAAIDAVLAGPGPLAQVASGADDPGAFVEDFCRWQDIPQIERLARHSRVPAVAAALLATPQVRFYHDHVLVKEAATAQRTPWHQDQPYYNVDGHGVRLPPSGTGSTAIHALTPWLMPRTFLTKEARWFPAGSLAELPDIDADPAAFAIRRFTLQPGDAIFFHFLTVHGAPGFPFRSRRRVLSLRYLAADARHAPRPWRTSPPFEGLEAELPAGAAMDHPLFPVVWPL